MTGSTLALSPEGVRGRQMGKYEVLCRLSTGGMAEIFLASQRGLGGFHKLVVLKTILPDIKGEEEFVRMFLDEAKVTAAFNHPHIAQVYDLDVAQNGELFLAMEFVPGATLVEVARACRQARTSIPLGFTLASVRDTALALHYAHTFTDLRGRASPIIHRDVAEKNIMVTYEGVTKLLDFGIAKSLMREGRTQVGTVKGTSGYMSPEQIMGQPLDARSDLFSLGVVLHECLTGLRLFHGKTPEACMTAVLRAEVVPPSRINPEVPPELDAVVLKSLARQREDRYATTLEFARALERAVGAHIWHPEQSGELMQRLFAERREQTRELLVSGVGEHTEEIKLAQLFPDGLPVLDAEDVVVEEEHPEPERYMPPLEPTPPPQPRSNSSLPTAQARPGPGGRLSTRTPSVYTEPPPEERPAPRSAEETRVAPLPSGEETRISPLDQVSRAPRRSTRSSPVVSGSASQVPTTPPRSARSVSAERQGAGVAGQRRTSRTPAVAPPPMGPVQSEDRTVPIIPTHGAEATEPVPMDLGDAQSEYTTEPRARTHPAWQSWAVAAAMLGALALGAAVMWVLMEPKPPAPSVTPPAVVPTVPPQVPTQQAEPPPSAPAPGSEQVAPEPPDSQGAAPMPEAAPPTASGGEQRRKQRNRSGSGRSRTEE